MGRLALRLGGVCALLLCGLAASLVATGPAAVLATTSTSSTATTATSPASAVIAISGHGYGHGLGLSQWGADGYAQHGWTYEQILSHYYSGTTLGPASVSTVRVLLLQAAKATLASAVPWTVTDATGIKVALAPGQLVLKASLAIPGQKLQAPLTFSAAAPMSLRGVPYRGKLVLESAGKQLQVVNVVGLEAYLKGVVPAEMPSTWPPAALEAQAVAARSYALANLMKSRTFDLYGDTRSQAYGGVAAESPAASAAVDATKGQVVLYGGKVADTLYFSSSGGRTASSIDETGTAVPYLVSVPDPYDALAPYHDWGPVLFSAARVGRLLKLGAPISSMQSVVGSSERVKTVTAVTDDDVQATVTGAQLRDLLGLRSTWFTSALLELQPPASAITFGGATTLSGLAQGVDSLYLEAKTPTQDWTQVGELALGSDGTFSTIVKPQVSTQYRLAWDNVRAGLAKIAVAARVAAQVVATGATGTERPALAGAAVQLQQQSGAAWSTLASTTADATGAWSFAQTLQPGTYRVRVAPGRGIAAGVSATVQLP